jgi:DNA-directed RNA polymerase beta' subunit
MKTAHSGYAQRKIIKVCEDLVVQQDGTVRNANNKIIQFQYGDDNMDPRETVMVDNKMTFIDVERLVDKLNTRVEIKGLFRV